MTTWAEQLAEQRANKIESIRDQMKALVGADNELAHSEADKLLVELVDVLGDYLNPYGREVIAEIIESYKGLDKWYA